MEQDAGGHYGEEAIASLRIVAIQSWPISLARSNGFLSSAFFASMLRFSAVKVWRVNGEIFYTLKEAQIIIEQWRCHYNTNRPHSALGYRPPAPEAIVPMDQRPVMH